MARRFTQNLLIVIALVLVIVICLTRDNQAQILGVSKSYANNRSGSILLSGITESDQDVSTTFLNKWDVTQISNVQDLEGVSDVSVSAPYYDALKSLVEYYGVEVIFPDGTFRGNQTLTRGEFVSYLHDSLSVIRELLISPSGISHSDPSLLVDNLEQITAVLTQDNLSWDEELVQIQTRLNKLEERVGD
ncbi:MAG: S-layer homology domain-containing protein [Symploca sp. SIO1B1]|nr:S-layer homology domain-containing protein [Symploca sp. SIO1B1]